MNRLKLLKKIGMDDSDLSHIMEAVKEAEAKTNGEIAIATIFQSDSYSFVEAFFAMILSFFILFIISLFSNELYEILSSHFWEFSVHSFVSYIYIFIIPITLFFFAIANLPSIDRLIIPKNVKDKRVYNRAIRHFVESGIYKTSNRSGVLIFVSILERRVFVIADSGIACKVEQKEWDLICETMTSHLKHGKPKEAFIDGITLCGKLLSKYFPPNESKLNEYPDGLVLLEE